MSRTDIKWKPTDEKINRIDEKFNELKRKGKTALITYLTAGDPDLDTTVRLVKLMESKGADLVEIGIPHSDPLAEGPVIQRANARALGKGIRIRDIMESVEQIRNSVNIPLVYLLYVNCILRYGKERFFLDCASRGIDGVIIPDLPFEESGEISGVAEKYGVHLVTLVAPTSTERLDKILENQKGFIYCVSSLGVTGARDSFPDELKGFMGKVAQKTSVPRAIGFGISTPEQAAELKKYCEGIIVGSAIVKRIEEGIETGGIDEKVGSFVAGLREVL
jgi:tryptophan synthase alpha chain